MDLRGKLSPDQVERACSLLNYQPFIITDDIQTGAAYSWNVGDFSSATFVFRRSKRSPQEWETFTRLADMQRRMYDAFVDAIAERYQGGSFLDVACNNGYFPIRAQLRGMAKTFGADPGMQYGLSIDLLNEALGTSAEFLQVGYDHRISHVRITGGNTMSCRLR